MSSMRRSNLLLTLGLDWLGVSFLPESVPPATVWQPIAALGAAYSDWISSDSLHVPYTGCGIRAREVYGRVRFDVSGGCWPPEAIAELCSRLAAWGPRYHRLDAALNMPVEFGERFAAKIAKALRRGHYVGFSSHAQIKSYSVSRGDGQTIYLGSRESPSVVRVYRRSEECWRWEREFKRARATQIASWLADNGTAPPSILQSVVREWTTAGIEFGKPDPHQHRDRCRPYSWWSRFRQHPHAGTLPALPPVQGDLTRSLAWVEAQVAPTWHTLQAAGYGDRLRDIVSSAPIKSAILEAQKIVKGCQPPKT